MESSTELKELFVALVNFQREVGLVGFDSDNEHFSSRYASLAAMREAVRKPLADNGLALIQGVTGEGSTVSVTTMLAHVSGQWIRSTLSMTPVKATPHGVGGAITYSRRYGMASLLGLVGDEDDDGNAASMPAAAPVAVRPVKAAKPGGGGEAEKLEALCKEHKISVRGVCSPFGSMGFAELSKEELVTARERVDSIISARTKKGASNG